MGRKSYTPPEGDYPHPMGSQHPPTLLHGVCEPVRLRNLRMELIRSVLLFRRVQRLYAAGALHSALCQLELEKDPLRSPATVGYRFPHHLLRIQPHNGSARQDPRTGGAFLDLQHTQRGHDDNRLLSPDIPHTHTLRFTHGSMPCQPDGMRFRHIYDTLLLRMPGIRPGSTASPTFPSAHSLLGNCNPCLLVGHCIHSPKSIG